MYNERFFVKFVSFHLLIKVFAVTTLPGADTLRTYINVLDFFILLVFIILSINFENLGKTKFNPDIPFLFLILVLILFLLSSFYVNIGFNLNTLDFFKLLSYILHFIVFFFIFPKYLKFSSENFDVFMKGFVYFGIFNSFFSILSLHFGAFAFRDYPTAIGILYHPNTTAFVYSIGIPILFYLYFNKKINIFFFGIILFIFSYCLLFTLSRAGYIGALVSLMVLFYNKSRKIFYFSLILTLFLLYTFYADLIALKTDSSFARTIIVLASINMILSNTGTFLWGYGVSRATEILFDEKQMFGSFEMNVNNPHNFILLLAIQFGMLLSAAYLFFIISVLFSGYKMKNRLEQSGKYKLFLLLSIIVGLLAQNIFEELIVVPEFPVFAFFLIILGSIYYNFKNKEPVKS